MNFGQALELAKNGKRITRMGWNGKDQYVVLGKEFAYKTKFDAGHGEYIASLHKDIGGQALVFFGTRGTQVGWLASQADMLAEDWIEYHEVKANDTCADTSSGPAGHLPLEGKATCKRQESAEERCCEKERDPWRKLITREEYRDSVKKLKEGELLFGLSGVTAVSLLEIILFDEDGE